MCGPKDIVLGHQSLVAESGNRRATTAKAELSPSTAGRDSLSPGWTSARNVIIGCLPVSLREEQ
ncbi:hypothetical protein DIPPA_05445 [Diplonema papillatum]|nr:hypothetical protein DIPPA_05445 [Diplonema papillatum]